MNKYRTMIRLNKYLAHCGIASRRKCDQLIESGKVAVNGKVVTTLGCVVDEKVDQVTFNGKLVTIQQKPIYILLNKPKGYITSLSDELGRKKVTDLIHIQGRIFPVGRLDKDTEGLLLLTNDGVLSYHLTHPKFLIDKIYQVTIDNKLKNQDHKKLELGILLTDGMTAICEIKQIPSKILHNTYKITIHEGKKRQIRRMFETLGYKVTRLVRIQFANLTDYKLSIGEWRYLTKMEIKELKRLAGVT